MSVLMGQATVPANSTTAVFTIPPGTVNTTMWQSLPMTSQVYIGTSVNVSTTNGTPISATPINMESYVSSKGATIYATTGNATASSFQYIISSGA
jgi:hypothetical protein